MAVTAIQKTKPLVFLKEVRTELGKVAWPSKAQAIRLTLIIIAVSLAVAAFIGSLDFLFTKLIALLAKQ